MGNTFSNSTKEYANMDYQNTTGSKQKSAPSIILDSPKSMLTTLGPDISFPRAHSIEKSKSNGSNNSYTLHLTEHGQEYVHETKESEFGTNEFVEIDVEQVLSYDDDKRRSTHKETTTCPNMNQYAPTDDANDMLYILSKYGFVIWESFDSEKKMEAEKKAMMQRAATTYTS